MAAEESTFPDGEAGSVISDTLSDAELITATRAGDAGAFAVLYTRHVDAARACARRLARSRAEADDLVAEGFAKVLGALRNGKGPDLAFRPYLLTALRNALYDRTRRDSRVEFTDEPPEPVNAVLLAADYEREDRAMVAQAYAALPERWQLVLWHTDVEGRQPAEIAPLLGISANSVAALAYRAREGLRQAYLSAHVNRGVADTCRGATEKLSAYVRDGLSARDRRMVQDHLDQCAACTALLGELQEANRSLKAVLIPVLAGVSATGYLSGLSGRGITRIVRRNPAPTAAGAVAAAALLVFAAAALSSPGGGDEAQALTVPPVGSGRPTTTTTLPRTTAPQPTPTTAAVPFTPPIFDTAVPPITVVPFDPNATTATTVRRSTTTTRPTTTRAPTTTTTTTTQPGQTATTTTTTTTSTTVPGTQAPAPPALQSTVTGLGPVYSGQNAYFSVKVANAASGNGGSARKVTVGPADGVVVTFNLPAGTSFTGASSTDWQCEVVGASVRCLLPRIDPGAETESVFMLDVPTTATGDFTISPLVMVNGDRIDAKPTTRQVADGTGITDFTVVPGGQLIVAGNTLLQCTTTNGDCSPGTMSPVAPSAAQLSLDGRHVAAAYLVWQGSSVPDASATLTNPSGATVAVEGAMTTPSGGGWAATADVTDVVRGGGSGSYTLAGVTPGSGADAFAGWTLIVVTEQPGEAPRGVAIKSPMVHLPAAGEETVTFMGLPAIGAPRDLEVAVLVGEGDSGLTGSEALELVVQDGAVPLTTDLHPSGGNAFRSRIIGQPVGAAETGTDLDRYVASQPGDQPTIDVRATTENDPLWLSAVAVAFDL